MPDMREEFEAWATNRCVSITKAPEAMMFFGGRRVPAGCYIMADTELAWEAWKASRAALNVRLPKPYGSSSLDAYSELAEFNRGIMECLAALQKAGIEVK